MSYTFGEKEIEYYKGKSLPVWKSPKYEQSKAKAIEVIESGKYGIREGDFWILMNSTKNEKMAYTGLIISHNGCLKINDSLPDEDKFRPECLSIDTNGYNDSLVYTYCCPEQKMYEVGEVSASNCQNAYPYAMALKRCFDRVILKISKLAFEGIYSDSEADEFKQKEEETPKPKKVNKSDWKMSEAQEYALVDLICHSDTDMDKLNAYFGVEVLNELSEEQYRECLDILSKKAKK